MRIGDLSAATGASPRSLRHYEKLGLISADRQPNGYREYGDDAVAAALTIRQLLDLGFPTELIRQVLPCTEAGGNVRRPDACSDVLRRVEEIRDDMDLKARRLAATRDTLTAYLEAEGAHSA
ncbi:MAG: MerR family transcriptional regulator [Humibacter sp.]